MATQLQAAEPEVASGAAYEHTLCFLVAATAGLCELTAPLGDWQRRGRMSSTAPLHSGLGEDQLGDPGLRRTSGSRGPAFLRG